MGRCWKVSAPVIIPKTFVDAANILVNLFDCAGLHVAIQLTLKSCRVLIVEFLNMSPLHIRITVTLPAPCVGPTKVLRSTGLLQVSHICRCSRAIILHDYVMKQSLWHGTLDMHSMAAQEQYRSTRWKSVSRNRAKKSIDRPTLVVQLPCPAIRGCASMGWQMGVSIYHFRFKNNQPEGMLACSSLYLILKVNNPCLELDRFVANRVSRTGALGRGFK